FHFSGSTTRSAPPEAARATSRSACSRFAALSARLVICVQATRRGSDTGLRIALSRVEAVARFRAFEALRERDFRLLFAGQAAPLVGAAAFLTALAWRTFTLAGSAKLGVVLTCEAIALLATLLIGGALADRFSRRRMMILSDLSRMVAVATLAALD